MSDTQNSEKTIGYFVRKFWWLIAIVLILVFVVAPVWSNYNSFVSQEAGITGAHDLIENEIGVGYKNLGGQDKVTGNVADLYLKAIREATSGTYGPDGAKAAMLWLKQTYPDMDLTTFNKMQEQIELVFNRIGSKQEAVRDMIVTYERSLGQFPGNAVASLFGFPRINLDDLKKMISSDEAKEAMKSKKLPGLPF